MELALTLAAFVFSGLLLLSLVGIVFPIKRFGFKSRKHAAQAALGSSIILICVIVVLGFVSQNNNSKTTIATSPEQETVKGQEPPTPKADSETAAVDEIWKLKALKEVRKEKSVVEAMFPENANSSFWVSMRDDGSRRDGFAEYICLVLKDNGMPSAEFIVIRVWDSNRLANDQLHEIGRNECQKP